jgi:ribulose-bisphosphate carboxylase large chain
MPDEAIRLTYTLTSANRADALARALEIAFEQTLQLPPGFAPAVVEERFAGRVAALRPAPAEDGRWTATLAYDPAVVGEDLPQLLNLMYGDVSLHGAIRLTDVELPPAVLQRLPGPRFGIEGLRRLAHGDERRPLLCVAVKPLGLSAQQLAERCQGFALAGIDLVKDDHGLANQVHARFAERVQRCQEAVDRANAVTGGHSLYLPNLTGPVEVLGERLELVRTVGCRAVTVSPMLIGLDTLRWLADDSALAILAHPALAGAYFQPHHGIAPDVLLGFLFRVAGSDGVIYPNVGGRYPFTRATCEAINQRLRAPLGGVRRAFPVPSGAFDPARLMHWIDRYGVDTIFLVDGGVDQQPDEQRAVVQLVETVRRHCYDLFDERDPA